MAPQPKIKAKKMEKYAAKVRNEKNVVIIRLDDFEYLFFDAVLWDLSSADLRSTHLLRDLIVSLFFQCLKRIITLIRTS